MGRYITSDDVKVHLELTDLSADTSPSLEAVNNWISQAENELDMRSHNQFDLHTVSDEYLEINGANSIFFTSHTPLVSITKIEVNEGDEWNENWTELDSSKYYIYNADIGMIKTKNYYWEDRSIRITYEAGYSSIPDYIKELALLLVEKRYIMSRLGIASGDTEVVSLASIRIADKMKSNLTYRLEGLEKEINDRFKMFAHGLKIKFFSVDSPNTNLPKRYRLI